MSITKILTEKDVDASVKLERVAEIVAKARDTYGNTDVEIPTTKVNTTNGYIGFEFLEDEGKVEVLRVQAVKLKAKAIEYVENHPGSNMTRKVEELLATNPYFANISAGTGVEYL
jgi:hypothetical protein